METKIQMCVSHFFQNPLVPMMMFFLQAGIPPIPPLTRRDEYGQCIHFNCQPWYRSWSAKCFYNSICSTSSSISCLGERLSCTHGHPHFTFGLLFVSLSALCRPSRCVLRRLPVPIGSPPQSFLSAGSHCCTDRKTWNKLR